MGPLTLPPWVGLSAVALGAVILAAAARTALLGRRRRRTWIRRDGRVVSSRLDSGAIRYQVAFRHDGREIRFWNRFTTGTGVDPVGREVVVLVDPTNPDDAVVDAGAPGAGVAGTAFGLFGVLVVAVGVFLLAR